MAITFNTVTFSKTTKDSDTAVAGDLKITSENKWAGPLAKLTINGRPLPHLKTTSYADRLRITRVDGAKFDLINLNIYSEQLPAIGGTIVCNNADGTVVSISIPAFQADKIFTLNVNATNITNALLTFGSYCGSIESIEINNASVPVPTPTPVPTPIPVPAAKRLKLRVYQLAPGHNVSHGWAGGAAPIYNYEFTATSPNVWASFTTPDFQVPSGSGEIVIEWYSPAGINYVGVDNVKIEKSGGASGTVFSQGENYNVTAGNYVVGNTPSYRSAGLGSASVQTTNGNPNSYVKFSGERSLWLGVSKPQAGETWKLNFNYQWDIIGAEPTPVPVPVPTPIPVPVPTPVPNKYIFGMISDASIGPGTYLAHKSAMDAFGFNGTRIWVGFDAKTGKLWNYDGIDRANEFARNGVATCIVLSPSTGASNVVFPQSAIDDIIKRLDKRVVIHLFNEVNLVEYWPRGNTPEGRADAFSQASRASVQLQAAGFQTGSPSFSWQNVSMQVAWYQEAAARGNMNFNKLVSHNYPNWDANWDGTWLSNFEEVLKALSDLAKLLRMSALVIDEWGFSPSIPQDKIATLLPKVKALFNKYAVESYYFIMTLTGTVASPHLPHDKWAWLIDIKTGKKQDKIAGAFAATAVIAMEK
jgi:hypothetical protein